MILIIKIVFNNIMNYHHFIYFFYNQDFSYFPDLFHLFSDLLLILITYRFS